MLAAVNAPLVGRAPAARAAATTAPTIPNLTG
jgi:hypothetical protein